MRESFEDKFRSKVKQTFDNYEAKFNPTLWEDMKERLNEKKREKVSVLGLMRKTAAIWLLLLVFTGVVLSKFIFSHKSQDTIGSGNITNQTSTQKDLSTKKYFKPQENISEKNKQLPKPQTKSLYADKHKQSQEISRKSSHKNFIFSKKKKKISLFPNRFSSKTKKKFIDRIWQRTIAMLHTTFPKVVNKMEFDMKSAEHIETVYFVAPSKKNKKKFIHRGNHFSVGVALKSAQNTSLNDSPYQQSRSIGVGLTSNIPIYRKWSLQAGIMLNRQNWKNQEYDIQSTANFAGFRNFRQESNMDLLMIDLPIKIQYPLVTKQKVKILASTGFSSYWYAQEKITASSIYHSHAAGRYNPLLSERTNAEHLNRFEAFRTFNLSFTLQYPISNKFALSLEPFTRFSLSEMTQKDLQLNMTGLRLRFDFLPKNR